MGRRCHHLVAASHQITELTPQRILRHDPQPHLIGNQQYGTRMIAAGVRQLFTLEDNIILVQVSGRLMQQVVDPQSQAIDQQDSTIMGSVDDSMDVRLFFNRCPALCFTIFPVPVNTLLHFRIRHITRTGAGGHIGATA